MLAVNTGTTHLTLSFRNCYALLRVDERDYLFRQTLQNSNLCLFTRHKGYTPSYEVTNAKCLILACEHINFKLISLFSASCLFVNSAP